MLAVWIVVGIVAVGVVAFAHHAGWKAGKRFHYRNGWNDARFPNARYRGND